MRCCKSAIVREPMPDVTLSISGNRCPMPLCQCPGTTENCHSVGVGEPLHFHSNSVREPLYIATLSVSRYSTLPLCQSPGTLHCHSVSLRVLYIATLSVSRYSTLPLCQSPGTLHCHSVSPREPLTLLLSWCSGTKVHCYSVGIQEALPLCYCPRITVHYLSGSVRQLLHLPLCQYLWNSAHRQAVSDREPLHSATLSLSRNRSTMPRCRCAETTVYCQSVSVLIPLYAATLCVRKPLYIAFLSLSRTAVQSHVVRVRKSLPLYIVSEPLYMTTLSVSGNLCTFLVCGNHFTLLLYWCSGSPVYFYFVAVQEPAYIAIPSVSVNHVHCTLPLYQCPGTTIHSYSYSIREPLHIANLSVSVNHSTLSHYHCQLSNVLEPPCLAIQIKHGLPYCVTCPCMSTHSGSLNPGTRQSRVPTRLVVSWDPYEYWGRWHSFGKTYLISIIAQIIQKCFDGPFYGI